VQTGQKCLFSSLSEFLWYTSSTATYSPTYETLDDIQQELVQGLFHVDEQVDEMKLCCYVRACRENLQHRTTNILNTQLEAIGNFSVEEDKNADLEEDKIADLQTNLTEYIVQQRELKRQRQRRPASTSREISAYIESFRNLIQQRRAEELVRVSRKPPQTSTAQTKPPQTSTAQTKPPQTSTAQTKPPQMSTAQTKPMRKSQKKTTRSWIGEEMAGENDFSVLWFFMLVTLSMQSLPLAPQNRPPKAPPSLLFPPSRHTYSQLFISMNYHPV
jgi:hypothetical protein